MFSFEKSKMLPVSKDELEFATPLSVETHELKGVWMWLVLNSNWVLFTKTYDRVSIQETTLAIHRNTLQVSNALPNDFTSKELEMCKWLLSTNKIPIERYVCGELGAEELLCSFIRLTT